MAKVLCVLCNDPVDGYPKSYPRDDLPKIERYPCARALLPPGGYGGRVNSPSCSTTNWSDLGDNLGRKRSAAREDEVVVKRKPSG